VSFWDPVLALLWEDPGRAWRRQGSGLAIASRFRRQKETGKQRARADEEGGGRGQERARSGEAEETDPLRHPI